MHPNSPPTVEEVIKRLKILHWVVSFVLGIPDPRLWPELRATLSPEKLQAFLAQLRNGRDQLCFKLKNSWHWDAMTIPERQLARTIPCEVSEQQWMDGIWTLEAVAVLLWALGRLQALQPFDAPSGNPSLLRLVEQGLNGAQLRARGEIEKMRETAQSWHWRSRTRELHESGQTPPPEMGFPDFDSIVRRYAKNYLADGTIPEIISEDFPAKGKAYRDLTDLEWSEVRSITMERHHALNWLCGYGHENRWDQTPTET